MFLKKKLFQNSRVEAKVMGDNELIAYKIVTEKQKKKKIKKKKVKH